MFKKKRNNSTMESEEDKQSHGDMLEIEENTSSAEGWLRGSIRKVKEILSSLLFGLLNKILFSFHLS